MTAPLTPSVENGGQNFLKALRSQTAPAHEALEAHPFSQQLTDSGLTRAGYIRYLRIMQQVVAGMEAALHPALRAVITDIDEREKGPWLEQDLGFSDAPPDPLPPFRLSLPPGDIPAGLGAYYVLEGSTLGGRVILKSLPPALQVDAAQGAAYFAGYGAQTGPMWQRFLQILTDYALRHDCEAEIIAGAQSAFTDILNYFNTCQALFA